MVSHKILVCVALLHMATSACGLSMSVRDGGDDMNIVTMNGVAPTGRLAFDPVVGATQMGAQIPGKLCKDDNYHESLTEFAWRTNVSKWTKTKEILCSRLQESKSDDWIRAVAGTTSPSTAIFSTLCKRGEAPQLLEPLAGILRSPRHMCKKPKKGKKGWIHLMDVDYLVVADKDSANLRAGGKKIFFDAGGTRFTDAMRWFTSTYEARGIEFDHIYVWEYVEQGTEAYWDGVSHETRKQWEPKLTFYDGVGVTADPMDKKNNVLERIKAECDPDDFCAFKLDIDTPSVELPLVQQLLVDSEAQLRTDEFFFEHHVHGLMQRCGWAKNVNGEFADSYEMFSKLRNKGIRAHSWV